MAVRDWWPVACLAASLAAVPCRAASPEPTATEDESMANFVRPPNDVLKRTLTPDQYQVACNNGTEPPFRNTFWNHHEAGIYVDVISGEPLFSSVDKFDSGTGWPSFTAPIEKHRVVEKKDASHGTVRTEVRSRHGDAHLGHLFSDGPAPTGQRYCINSASLRFVPVERLSSEGYGRFLPLFGKADGGGDAAPGVKASRTETATLAGGCFWGMEEILRKVPGVLETRVGYTGGKLDHPTYENVRAGRTGHAESIEVVFDPSKLSYEALLERWFFRMHDPTTPNRQGNDVGTQYRSAIFVHSAEQRRVADAVRERVDRSGKWPRPVATEIADAKAFWPAEGHHQKYLSKNPGGYTCHWLRE